MDYGLGCIWVSAHDQRDFDFAKKYNLDIKTVVRPYDKGDDYKVTDESISSRRSFNKLRFFKWYRCAK